MAAAVATRRAAPRLRELPGAETAYISPHHKDGLVLVLWISLSLLHFFLTKFSRRGGTRLSTTELSGVGVSGLKPAADVPARALARPLRLALPVSLNLCAHFFYTTRVF